MAPQRRIAAPSRWCSGVCFVCFQARLRQASVLGELGDGTTEVNDILLSASALYPFQVPFQTFGF